MTKRARLTGNFLRHKECKIKHLFETKTDGKSNTEIAEALRVSRQTLQDILAEKQSVTPQMALRLGKLAGNGPDLWLNMQRAYDLAAAEDELGALLDEIPTLTEAA